MKGKSSDVKMAELSKSTRWTHIVYCCISLAMFSLSFFNTFNQERLSTEVRKLRSKIAIIEDNVYKMMPRLLNENSRAFSQNIVKPEGEKLEKFDWLDSGNYSKIHF